MYFVKDNVLYLYDYCIAAGMVHIYFVEFSALNGEKINEYNQSYSLGSDKMYTDTYINTYNNINNIEELQNYIYGISKIWYKEKSEKWAEVVATY